MSRRLGCKRLESIRSRLGRRVCGPGRGFLLRLPLLLRTRLLAGASRFLASVEEILYFILNLMPELFEKIHFDSRGTVLKVRELTS